MTLLLLLLLLLLLRIRFYARLQDQLIIFMALAGGSSSMLCNEPTLHTRTAIAVVQQLLPQAQFSISTRSTRAEGTQLYMIQCRGAGLAL
jgi:RNA 3'-terminal phosphate cyclase (ATP)